MSQHLKPQKIKEYDQELCDMRYYIQESSERYKILDYIIKYAEKIYKKRLLKKYIHDVCYKNLDDHLYKTEAEILVVVDKIIKEYNDYNETKNKQMSEENKIKNLINCKFN
jgi:hypothetical protein